MTGDTLLYICIGYLSVLDWIDVVDNFSVKVLIGTLLIDRLLKSNLPEKQVVVPKRSEPVAILATFTDNISTLADAQSENERKDEKRTLFQVVRRVLLKTMSETPLMVTSS